MHFIDVFKLICAALIPIVLSIGGVFLLKSEKFNKIKNIYKILIFGLSFGFSSILGTVLGAQLSNGAIVNVRDASPIICGLLFGGPSGIIAGFISGAYRALTPIWNPTSSYTAIACSISTALSGVFAALVRQFIFNKKKGTWYYGFFLGVLVEDFHMLLTILTHMDDVLTVYNSVIKVCTIPMILINSFAVMIAIGISTLLNHEKLFEKDTKMHVSTKVQITLICTILVSYSCTAFFSKLSIDNVVRNSVEKELNQALSDVKDDIDNAVDSSMVLKLDDTINLIGNDTSDLSNEKLIAIAERLDISEINIVNFNGVITFSSAGWEGYSMDAGKDAVLFNALISAAPGKVMVQELRSTTFGSSDLVKYACEKLPDYNDNRCCYIEIGISSDKYFNLLEENFSDSVSFRHIKQKGFVSITDEEGNVIASLLDSLVVDTIDISDVSDGRFGNYYTSSTYVNVEGVKGYYICAFADTEESDQPSKIGFIAISLAEIFLYLILYCIIYVAIKYIVIDKIAIIGRTLRKISSGDLNARINERHSKEFDLLSTDINNVINTLNGFIEKEANKNAEELAFAKSIQYSVLPAVFPMNDKFEIYASMNTAKKVGGDFYDFYYIDREHMLIEIADVSGKGIPAAMFMMRSKTLLKSFIESGMDLDVAFIEANKGLCEGNETQTFVTVWAGIVDLTNGHVEYVNAGHNPPVLCRDGKFEYLQGRPGFVLGGLEDFKYQKQSFDIKPGDIIYLYTDGVTEANNENHELYGEERLLEEIEGKTYNSKTLCEKVKRNLKKFVKEAEQSDDITMLAFKLYNVESTNIKVVDAEIKNLPEIMDFIDDLLERNNATLAAKSQIDVAVDEIFSNIAFYAYPEGQIGKAKVSVIMSKENDEMTIIFEDRGKPYNPLEKEDPNTTLSLEEKSIGGLGIFIVKKTMDSMEYENVNGHNVLTLRKKIR